MFLLLGVYSQLPVKAMNGLGRIGKKHSNAIFTPNVVTSLLRSRPLMQYCHFGVPTINYSDSDQTYPIDLSICVKDRNSI